MKVKLDHNRMTDENKKLTVQVDAGINEMTKNNMLIKQL
jgi:hypothetical protein